MNAEEPLEGDLPPRAARLLLAEAEDYLAHLDRARHHGLALGLDVTALEEQIRRGRAEVSRYADLSAHRLDPRRRPGKEKQWKETDARSQYMLCIDECGSYQLHPEGDPFPVFCVCGVIIQRNHYDVLQGRLNEWKDRWLGSSEVVIHEPDLRKFRSTVLRARLSNRDEILSSLHDELGAMNFTVISAVIHKPEFFSRFSFRSVDPFLHRNQYLICLDFLLERFAHFLYHRGGDGWGKVFAESRGRLEDARVQHEYVRLQIDGTQFMADATFRYHLGPTIEFLPKAANHAGLQIADLLARACAEKVLRPATNPDRWDIVVPRLYDGCTGEPEKYGLKTFPVHSRELIFGGKADGDAEASPSTD